MSSLAHTSNEQYGKHRCDKKPALHDVFTSLARKLDVCPRSRVPNILQDQLDSVQLGSAGRIERMFDTLLCPWFDTQSYTATQT